MSVEGVAIATVVAKWISAIAIVYILIKRKNAPYCLKIKELRIEIDILKKIARFGLPMGVQSSLFSLSNIFITSAVNTFSKEIVSARSIANSIDELLSTALASYSHASMTFIGQNYGANKSERIKKSLFCSVSQVLIVGSIIGTILFIFKTPIALLYIDANDPARNVILMETEKIMSFMLYSYLFHGLMNSLAGTMRGLGYSFSSMLINLVASCILRVLYIVSIFPAINNGNILNVYVIYPISWFAACLTYSVFLAFRWKKIKEKCMLDKTTT